MNITGNWIIKEAIEVEKCPKNFNGGDERKISTIGRIIHRVKKKNSQPIRTPRMKNPHQQTTTRKTNLIQNLNANVEN